MKTLVRFVIKASLVTPVVISNLARDYYMDEKWRHFAITLKQTNGGEVELIRRAQESLRRILDNQLRLCETEEMLAGREFLIFPFIAGAAIEGFREKVENLIFPWFNRNCRWTIFPQIVIHADGIVVQFDSRRNSTIEVVNKRLPATETSALSEEPKEPKKWWD